MLKEVEDMHRGHNHDEATGWSAFLAGAFIGASVALLFAPQPGTELRGRLRDYTNRMTDDLVEKGQETWDTVVERGKEFYEKGEGVIRDAGQSAREFATQGQEVVKDARQSAKEFAQHTQEMAREPGRSAL
jgi:gas vesicle protein